MNSLSWLIYAIQVFDTIHKVSGVTAVATLLFGMIPLGVLAGLIYCEGMDELRPALRMAFKWWVTIIVAGAFIHIITPSRSTLLLIAGSEIGQRTAQSQEFKDIVNPGMELLKTWIKKETERLTNDAQAK